jgi:predicted nucleotidyltransferase
VDDGSEIGCNEHETKSSTMLDQPTLDEIIRRIVEVAQPEKIILFGSAARGDMNRHSDVDLLIIKEGADRRSLAGRISENLYGVGAAVDVVVVTPADVERYKDSHALVIKPALREGRVVYESGIADGVAAER